MTDTRSAEERISLWLEEEAVGHLPDHVLDATFDRTRAIRRRRGSSVWRSIPMLRPTHALIAVGAAAIVVVVGVAALRPGASQSGIGSPTSSPSPSATVATASPGQGASDQPLGLAVVELDGSVRRDLAMPLDAWAADLSTDGSKVVFMTSSTDVGACGACAPAWRPALVTVGSPTGAFVDPGVEGVTLDRDAQPTLSPDGRMLAFRATDATGNVDIYVAELGAGDSGVIVADTRRLTTDPAVDEFPTWSPDGATILYDNTGATPLDDSGFSPTQEIWSVSAAGGAPVRLTDDQEADTQPDVSSDGTVAFWRSGEIWTMDLQGGDQRRLDAVPGEVGFNPRWSPDGRRMALLQYDPSERARPDPSLGLGSDLPLLKVIVVDLGNSELATVGPRVASDLNPVSWTPDGSALLINRYDAGG